MSGLKRRFLADMRESTRTGSAMEKARCYSRMGPSTRGLGRTEKGMVTVRMCTRTATDTRATGRKAAGMARESTRIRTKASNTKVPAPHLTVCPSPQFYCGLVPHSTCPSSALLKDQRLSPHPSVCAFITYRCRFVSPLPSVHCFRLFVCLPSCLPQCLSVCQCVRPSDYSSSV